MVEESCRIQLSYSTALEAAAYNPNSDNVEARRVLMDKGVKTRS